MLGAWLGAWRLAWCLALGLLLVLPLLLVACCLCLPLLLVAGFVSAFVAGFVSGFCVCYLSPGKAAQGPRLSVGHRQTPWVITHYPALVAICLLFRSGQQHNILFVVADTR